MLQEQTVSPKVEPYVEVKGLVVVGLTRNVRVDDKMLRLSRRQTAIRGA